MSDPAVLDADGNRIVSTADSHVVLEQTAGNSVYTKVAGASGKYMPYTTTLTSVAGLSMSQQYVKHVYATNKDTHYTLTTAKSAVTNNQADMNKVAGVIGPDDRKKDAMEGVVWLSDGGTGFIIDAHTIVTAAHCVFAYDTYEDDVLIEPAHWISNIKVYLADSNGVVDRSQSFAAVEAHIPENRFTNSSDMYDYALITVAEDLSDYCAFNLGMTYNIYDSSYFRNYDIYVTGFPNTIPEKDKDGKPVHNTNPKQMYTGVGHIVQWNIQKDVWCYDTDLTYGNSGGPVYVKETVYANGEIYEFNTAISICAGIHNASEPHYNNGPIFNAIMLKFYYNNPYANY